MIGVIGKERKIDKDRGESSWQGRRQADGTRQKWRPRSGNEDNCVEGLLLRSRSVPATGIKVGGPAPLSKEPSEWLPGVDCDLRSPCRRGLGLDVRSSSNRCSLARGSGT